MRPYNAVDAVMECPEHGDISHIAKKAKFCPTCGLPIIEVFHGKEKYMSYWNMFEDCDDLMQIDFNNLENDKMILVSNCEDKTHISLDKNDEGVYSLHDEGTYIHRFCENFKPQIRKLIDHKYVISVSYNFGVIVHWW